MGHTQVTKRSTHTRPGMHMQQCLAVPTQSVDTGGLYVCYIITLDCRYGCSKMTDECFVVHLDCP